jgi:hypothetical protein
VSTAALSRRPFALVYLVDLQMENTAVGIQVRREGPARWLQVFPDVSSMHPVGVPCGRCCGTTPGDVDRSRSARRANRFGFAEIMSSPLTKNILLYRNSDLRY